MDGWAARTRLVINRYVVSRRWLKMATGPVAVQRIRSTGTAAPPGGRVEPRTTRLDVVPLANLSLDWMTRISPLGFNSHILLDWFARLVRLERVTWNTGLNA